MREEKAKKLVRLVALIVFGVFSITSALLLFDKDNSEKYVSLHTIRHFGVAVTIWASLRTAFDFAMHQAKAVKAWFIGANLVTLSSVVLLCMIALRLEQVKGSWETTAQVSHLILVHAALALYLIWDMLAKNYYKTEYHEWYEAYSLLMSYDLIITVAFFCSYIPYLPTPFTNDPQLDIKSFIDGAIGFLLFTEFLAYYMFAPEVRSRAVGKNILSVPEGYNLLAPVYDRGNAIMRIERRHTLSRLANLNVAGTIVDLGCGTGFYTSELAERADKVIAIDPSEGMLEVFKTKLGEKRNVEVIDGPAVSALRDLSPESVDGVLCCLVMDHLDQANFQVTLRDICSILRPNGWLYLTDVNAYYAKLQQPFAKFIDASGVAQKIQVFPHTMKEVFSCFRRAGFDTNKLVINEALVSQQDANECEELEDLAGFPLIVEYFVKK